MSKPAKSKTIVLRLSPDTLRTFPHEPASTPAKAKSPPDNTPAAQLIEPPAADAADAADTADTAADSTSAMNGASTPSSLAPKRKGPAPKKRGLATVEGSNGTTPKPGRGKPGPRKKQKMGDMINDPNNKTVAPMAAPKLGPKANQGAINANLRSLDRTGKFKVRKWERKGLQLRSFTGVVWQVPSYVAPPRGPAFLEDVRSDSTGSTDTKLKDESSTSSAIVTTPQPPLLNGVTSSPAPFAAAS